MIWGPAHFASSLETHHVIHERNFHQREWGNNLLKKNVLNFIPSMDK